MPALLELWENEPFTLPGEFSAELSAALGPYLERRDGQWLVRRVVGHVALQCGSQVLIRSRKAPTAAVLSMLAFIDPSLEFLHFHAIRPGLGDSGELGNLLAQLFCRELSRALGAQGIQRQYQRFQEETSFVRGRLVFSGATLRQHQARQNCESWRRWPDTPLNRTLAAALLKIHLDQRLRENNENPLRYLRSQFADVCPIANRALVTGQQQLDRGAFAFRTSLRLAQLLLADSGAESGQEFAGLSFLLNVERLFERCVQKAFEFSGLRCLAGAPLSYSAYGNSRCSTHNLRMDLWLPDLPLVVDAKFKSKASVDNLHQMLTYCQLTGSRQAVLVFPHGMSGPRAFKFQTGADSVTVFCVELDLSGTNRGEWQKHCHEMVVSVFGALRTDCVSTATLPRPHTS